MLHRLPGRFACFRGLTCVHRRQFWQGFDAARLEEEYNVERWGMIEGGHDMDRGNTTLTLTAASTLIWLRNASLPKPALP